MEPVTKIHFNINPPPEPLPVEEVALSQPEPEETVPAGTLPEPEEVLQEPEEVYQEPEPVLPEAEPNPPQPEEVPVPPEPDKILTAAETFDAFMLNPSNEEEIEAILPPSPTAEPEVPEIIVSEIVEPEENIPETIFADLMNSASASSYKPLEEALPEPAFPWQVDTPTNAEDTVLDETKPEDIPAEETMSMFEAPPTPIEPSTPDNPQPTTPEATKQYPPPPKKGWFWRLFDS